MFFMSLFNKVLKASSFFHSPSWEWFQDCFEAWEDIVYCINRSLVHKVLEMHYVLKECISNVFPNAFGISSIWAITMDKN